MEINKQSLHVVLIGPANSGKTTLFNTLTGYQQKVANYGGVTVNYKKGSFTLPSGRNISITDLPGVYSFHPISPDEAVTHQFCQHNQQSIDLMLCIIDATKLTLHIKLIVEAQQWGKPLVVVLNRITEAKQRGIHINTSLLATRLGVPVIPVQAKSMQGTQNLITWLNQKTLPLIRPPLLSASPKALARGTIQYANIPSVTLEDRLDRWVLHPWIGPLLLIVVMAAMSQIIFVFAEPIQQFIENYLSMLSHWLAHMLPSNSLLYSLMNESLLGGLGTIFSFCPQILLLFTFIFLLEESGYLPRAVFLVDHLLFKAGLTGRALIPLLSSFACTIPSITATRSIQHPRDRLVTILVLPLITCSARLPIYILLISAFIPSKTVCYGLFNLQGMVLFGLYILGMTSALMIAWIMKKLYHDSIEPMLLMELPNYQLPKIRDILLGLWDQLKIFCYRIGSVILALNVLLWAACRFPAPPLEASYPPIYYSIAGYLGRLLTILFKPIGFNWQICTALIPGLMAREVAISALGTVYAMSNQSAPLSTVIANQWSLATALSLLAWYVFAPQCLSTLTVIQRETGSWRNMIITAVYLFTLAYLAGFFAYQVTCLWQ